MGSTLKTGQSGSGFNSTLQLNGSVSTSSPPHLSLSSSTVTQNAMAAEVYSPLASQAPSTVINGFPYTLSPIGQHPSYDAKIPGSIRLSEVDRMGSSLNSMNGSHSTNGIIGGVAILMRRLPRNTSQEALRSMLLFAKDLIDAEFIPSEYSEDGNFLTAIARFETLHAAEEAQAMLDGKPNSANEANMIVEILSSSSGASLSRRNTIDRASSRRMTNPVGQATVPPQLPRQTSRFNGAFQSLEKMATANGTTANVELPAPDGSSRFNSLFSAQSPIGNLVSDRPRVTGKSVIDQDVDEDTGELLKDPVAYARNGHSGSLMPRRSTNPPVTLSRFANLSLSTNLTSKPMPQFSNTRPAVNMGNPTATVSPNIPNMGLNAGYHLASPQYHRLNYPPVNPADQNPPCNTLYVGNLPHDTSEDELKALFSKQRGYKRLCFRNKQNGPMCFVEFEDVSFATKALHELYGYQLSNSVKGGIRLSFSKNPLGVRTGQPGSMSPSTPMTPPGSIPGINGLGGMATPVFSTASGPPPGLSVPPGLSLPIGINSGVMTPTHSPLNSVNGAFNVNNGLGLGIGGGGVAPLRSAPLGGSLIGGAAGPNMGSMNGTAYPDYMMGR